MHGPVFRTRNRRTSSPTGSGAGVWRRASTGNSTTFSERGARGWAAGADLGLAAASRSPTDAFARGAGRSAAVRGGGVGADFRAGLPWAASRDPARGLS